jgi:methyl-accepting chemotaxis protein
VELQQMADGDLRELQVVVAEDEIAAAAVAVGKIQLQLTSALREMRVAGAGISQATEALVQVSSQHEMGAAQQVASLVTTVATTEELARSAAQIAEAAMSVASLAQSTLRSAESGRKSSETFVGAMERTKAENQAIADSVVRLNKRVQEIGKIVEFINGVADKSDLLALNAELEGTKAGEVGRGFSLVAEEIRRLAENVLESTKEIEGLIDEIREATTAAVTATTAGVQATGAGSTLATQVSESLKEIVTLAGQTSDAVRAISLATQQQQTGTDQLAEAMADILRVTQQSLAATKQVSAANVDLTALAQDLKAVVSRFDIREGSA